MYWGQCTGGVMVVSWCVDGLCSGSVHSCAAALQDETPLQGKQRLLKTSKHEAFGILEGLQYFGYK
jgi:hypothetical protein